MTQRELLKMMLQDAINWQVSYVDSVRDTEYEKDARKILGKYRAYAKKRFGDMRSNVEIAMDNATLMNLEEIKKMHE
jgi:hypothetical protein